MKSRIITTVSLSPVLYHYCKRNNLKLSRILSETISKLITPEEYTEIAKELAAFDAGRELSVVVPVIDNETAPAEAADA